MTTRDESLQQFRNAVEAAKQALQPVGDELLRAGYAHVASALLGMHRQLTLMEQGVYRFLVEMDRVDRQAGTPRPGEKPAAPKGKRGRKKKQATLALVDAGAQESQEATGEVEAS